MTESAGRIGTPLILIIAGYFYTIRVEPLKEKIKIFFKSVIVLGILLGVFAFVNEHFTKEVTKLARPSHKYILEQSGNKISLDSIRSLTENERRLLLDNSINDNPVKFNSIDKQVLNHWIEEAGFSFPSGHSFNAFLLACILTFNMYKSRSKTARTLYLLPFIWATAVAVSRVSIGAHSALDVSFGAATALLVAHGFLYFEHSRKWLTHR